MRRPRASILPRRLTLAAVLAAATLVPAAAPTAAALPGHTGTRGVHVLIDAVEYPGITCHYTTSAPGRLKRVAVRRPVIYAPNTSANRDHRWVGWRYLIQRSTDEVDWETIHTSEIQRAVAYEDRPAALLPSGKNLVGVDGSVYRAVVQLWWYTASGTRSVTGRAKHPTRFSLQVVGDRQSPYNASCPGTLDPVAAGRATATTPAAPSHLGAYGLHALVDSYEEFPGAICRVLPDDDLRITVRAPAVFAADGVGGAQQVRWRYRIDGMPPPTTAGPTPPAYIYTSAWVAASATLDRAARWTPTRSHTIDNPQWPYYLVSVRIEWLGGGSPTPYAVHAPYHQNGLAVTGYCVAGPL